MHGKVLSTECWFMRGFSWKRRPAFVWEIRWPANRLECSYENRFIAAQGLTFLHEEGPFQAMFHEFSTANMQIDKDFSEKLSGYGCITHIQETDISCSSAALGNLSEETLERGLLTPKSNAWSSGIVLLELLTGRKNLDSQHPKEERNLVKWSKPFLADDGRLSLIMDPQLKGRFPSKAARTISDIAQRCLQKDPSERPTMRTIVEQLKTIQVMKYPSRFPLQEQVSKPKWNYHPATKVELLPVTTNPPAIIFSHKDSCSTVVSTFMILHLSLEDLDRLEGLRASSSSVRRSNVEGF